MDGSTYRNEYRNSKTASPIAKWYLSGMRAYAIASEEQTGILTVLAALVLAGILAGVVCRIYTADAAFDAQAAQDAYLAARSYSTYETPRAYLTFFAAWFFHVASQSAPALLAALCVQPMLPAGVLCFLRGFASGYSASLYSSAAWPFVIWAITSQLLFCAHTIYLCIKCVRYGRKRRALPPREHRQLSPVWLFSETAPLVSAVLLLLTAQGTLQLCISLVLHLL